MSEIILELSNNNSRMEGFIMHNNSYDFCTDTNQQDEVNNQMMLNLNSLNLNNDGDEKLENKQEDNDENYYEVLKRDSPITTIDLNLHNNKNDNNNVHENLTNVGTFLAPETVVTKEDAVQEFAQSESNLEKIEQTIKITNFLDEAYKFGANAIDLSKKALDVVPMYMNKLENLQYLYLNGNNLTELPLDFFAIFHMLQWLDLRDNQLVEIPTYNLCKHENLRYLLLENNKITRLPVELGYVRYLKALNLHKNPIEFPPSDVIAKGVRLIKRFLRDNDELNKVNNEIDKYRQLKEQDFMMEYKYRSELFRDEWNSDNDDDENDNNEYYEYDPSQQRYKNKLRQQSTTSIRTRRSSTIMNNQGIMISHKKVSSASALDIPFVEKISNNVRPQTEMRNDRMAQAKLEANNISKKNLKPRRLLSITDIKTKTDSMVYRNFELENALKNGRSEKYMKKKLDIDTKVQKVKDAVVVDEFRDELKDAQKKLRFKRLVKGIDYNEPARLAPFDVDEDHMMVMTNQTREQIDKKLKEARMQALSPETLMQIEEERRMRDHILQQKIRDYTKKLLARRNEPKGSPKKDRIEAARDLRELKKIEKELEQRRLDFQYKYKAFTGDMVYVETAKLNNIKAHHFMPFNQR